MRNITLQPSSQTNMKRSLSKGEDCFATARNDALKLAVIARKNDEAIFLKGRRLLRYSLQ